MMILFAPLSDHFRTFRWSSTTCVGWTRYWPPLLYLLCSFPPAFNAMTVVWLWLIPVVIFLAPQSLNFVSIGLLLLGYKTSIASQVELRTLLGLLWVQGSWRLAISCLEWIAFSINIGIWGCYIMLLVVLTLDELLFFCNDNLLRPMRQGNWVGLRLETLIVYESLILLVLVSVLASLFLMEVVIR